MKVEILHIEDCANWEDATLTVDGDDLFPTAGRTTDLAYRIYFTPSGLAGLPTLGQLTEAIRHRRVDGSRVGGATG